MVKGVVLISWDVVEGGTVKMTYPDNFKVPDNVVQQIQISHNFTESYIITEEENWNSISFYNEDKELIIMLVLERYDDGQDYKSVLEEFNKEIESDAEGKQLMEQLKRIYNFSLNVFRTRDEVISKLSNEVALLRTREYDLEKKFEFITQSNHIPVKSKIQILLAAYDYLTFEKFEENIKTSKYWLKKVLDSLLKEEVIGFNEDDKSYFLIY